MIITNIESLFSRSRWIEIRMDVRTGRKRNDGSLTLGLVNGELGAGNGQQRVGLPQLPDHLLEPVSQPTCGSAPLVPTEKPSCSRRKPASASPVT